MTSRVTVRACAKINLALRVLGTRGDGFHEVRTTLQSIALHDVLTISRARGPLQVDCDEPGCPTGRRNIVARAAVRLWRAAGRTGQPDGVRIHIEKQVPMSAGLGGGSADAAAALRGLTALWRVAIDHERLASIAAALGADVPYFLDGGTALGVERGDLIFPLIDAPRRWVVLVVPPFGVSTPDAYRWWDERQATGRGKATLKGSSRDRIAPRDNRTAVGRPFQRRLSTLVQSRREATNDLQAAVMDVHPAIGRIVRALNRAGALQASMSGSGSAVFGLFATAAAAEAAAGEFAGRGARALVTRTLGRDEYARLTAPRLARK